MNNLNIIILTVTAVIIVIAIGYQLLLRKVDVYLIASAIIACACVLLYFKHCNSNYGLESFVDIPSTLQEYGVKSKEEALDILNGTWNEDISLISTDELKSNLNLYFSTFSYKSRFQLSSSPYTWNNISPFFIKNLPETCQASDNKIIFTSSPVIYNASEFPLVMYTQGISTKGIQGNGPKGMNLGLNINNAQSQSFSVFFLMSFKNNADNGEYTILKTWANSINNNGLRLSYIATADNGISTYSVRFRISVVDKDLDIAPITIDITDYYLFTVSFDKITSQ